MKKIIACFCFAALITSCKKDNKVDTSKADLLTAKPYTVISAYTKKMDGTIVNDYTTLQACKKDDFTTYFKNKVVETNEGITKCSAADPQIYLAAQWNLKNNETILQWRLGSDSVDFVIKSLTENELVVDYIQPTYTQTVTYIHK